MSEHNELEELDDLRVDLPDEMDEDDYDMVDDQEDNDDDSDDGYNSGDESNGDDSDEDSTNSKSKNENSKEVNNSVKTKKAPNKAQITVLVLFFSAIGYYYLNDFVTDEGQPTPTDHAVEAEQAGSKMNMSGSTSEVVRVNKVDNINPNVVRELKLAVETPQFMAEFQNLKDSVQSLQNQLKSDQKSLKTMKDFKDSIFKAIVDLHILTASAKVELENGSIITPKNNGYSYDVVSSAGHSNEMGKGTYLLFDKGSIISNTADSTFYFLYNNPQKDDEISDVYKITSSQGLTIVDKQEQINSLRKILAAGSNQTYEIKELNKQVVFFNDKSEISSVLGYKEKNSVLDLGSDLKRGKRDLVGYKDSNYKYFYVENGSVFNNGRVKSFGNGYTQELTINFSEYSNTKMEEGKNFIEISDNQGSVIDRIPSKKIYSVYLTKTESKGIVYISRDGIIYKLTGLDTETRVGKGLIIGKLDKGIIIEERVVLESEKLRYTDLNKLKGMTLLGLKDSYEITEDKIIFKLANKEDDVSKYSTTNKGTIIKKATEELVDTYNEFHSTSKIGGIIQSDNYTITIKSLDRVVVLNKEQNKETMYKNPLIRFVEEEFIELYAQTDNILDEVKKTINGQRYQSKKKGKGDEVYRFIDQKGNYIRPEDPDFNFKRRFILSEKISFIKKIEGSAFSYFYKLNTETGQLEADGIGKLLIKDKDNIESKIFKSFTEQHEISSSKNTVNNYKEIYTLSDFIKDNEYISKMTFETMTGEKIKILSPTSILIDNTKVPLSGGKFNKKLKIFVFNFAEEIDSRVRRKIVGSSSADRFERTIKKVYNTADNYYTKNESIVKIQGVGSIIMYKSESGENEWKKIYKEEIQINKNHIEITVEADEGSKETTSTKMVDLSTVKEMSKDMAADFVIKFNQLKIKEANKTTKISEEEEIYNNNILSLKQELEELTKYNSSMLAGGGLTQTVMRMTVEELEEAEKKEDKDESEFKFDALNHKLNYTILDRLHIKEGEAQEVVSALEENYFEDREGNLLEMNKPYVVTKVIGDFQTNMVIFKPIKIIYTDDEGKRQEAQIPEDATVMKYYDEEEDTILDGVPSWYINRAVEELPTTVTLATIGGVLDGMTAEEDGLSGAMSSLQGMTDDSDSTSAFSSGVAKGASAGINKVLEVIEEKSTGKKDLLITTSNIKITSVFMKTTELTIGN